MEAHSYIERVFGWSSQVLVPFKSRPILNDVQLYSPGPTKTSGFQTTLEKEGRGRERQRKMNCSPRAQYKKREMWEGRGGIVWKEASVGFSVDWRKGQVDYVSVSGILNERETFH